MKKDIDHWKYRHLDLRPILYKEPAGDEIGQFKSIAQDHGIDAVLDRKLIDHARLTLQGGHAISGVFSIKNTDRAVGAMLSNEISKKFKGDGLPDGTIEYRFRGSAGQSFGAFVAPGVQFILEGESNDYFGKGLSGGRLIVTPDREARYQPDQNIIIGNVALYGATSGEAYIHGMAGERFAVRNSGVHAVVEGVGDHGCEYMTGGVVVNLGVWGRNFAAGMSGGVAYLYDPEQKFSEFCNMEMVELEDPSSEDLEDARRLIRNHFRYTSSALALRILTDWSTESRYFVKVMPIDYKAVLMKRQHMLEPEIKVG